MKKLRLVLLLGGLLLTLAVSMSFPNISTNPYSNLVWLGDFKPTKNNKSFQSPGGWIGYFPRGYTLVLTTKFQKEYNAEFIVITKLDNSYLIDIISGPGAENTKILTQQEASEFITRNALDLSQIESNWKTLY